MCEEHLKVKMSRKFYIIGAGPGTRDLLTRYAAEKLESAELVLAAPRLVSLRDDAIPCPYTKLAQGAEQSTARTVALLVSGDVGFFSIAQRLQEKLRHSGEVELVCGLSSMQYFCAKICVPYDTLCVRSLHGREGSMLGAVSYNKRVFMLTGGRHNAASICQDLCTAGLGKLKVYLGENLGLRSERITIGTAEKISAKNCAELSVLLIENPEATDHTMPVRDSLLLRAEHVPMTKEEVRWVSAGKLAVRPHDVVWDVGAGTGAVSIELARRASDGLVYAIERRPEALKLLEANRILMGSYNVRIIKGEAPQVLDELPAPDCVFIGGSGGQLGKILAAVKSRNPVARVVVNAITLETLHGAMEALTRLGFENVGLVQLSAARDKALAGYTMLEANNSVFIISGGGVDGQRAAEGILL